MFFVQTKTRVEALMRAVRSCIEIPAGRSARLSKMFDLADEIVALASEHDRIQVADCNRPLTDRERARDRELEILIPAAVARLAEVAGIPIRATLDGDPRGRTVSVWLPTERSWSFGGEPGRYPV